MIEKITVGWVVMMVGTYLPTTPAGGHKSYEECRATAVIDFNAMIDRYGSAAKPSWWKCTKMEFIQLVPDPRSVEELEAK